MWFCGVSVCILLSLFFPVYVPSEVHKEFGTADLTKFIRSVEDVDETDSDGGTGSGSWPAKNKSRRQEGTGSKRPISQPNSTSRK